MIEVTFFISKDKSCKGFNISGHSGYSEIGSDIVCAAISSAAFMASNTLTDVLQLKAKINTDDGLMNLKLTSKDAVKAQTILQGFKLHVVALSEQYKKYIKVISTEV